jgi:hypothetical protein
MKRSMVPIIVLLLSSAISRSAETAERPHSVFQLNIQGLPKTASIGEKLQVEVCIKNVSDRKIWICRKPGFSIETSCQLDADTGISNKEVQHSSAGIGGDPKRKHAEYDKSDFLELDPGTEYKRKIEILVELEYRHKMDIECVFKSKYDGKDIGKDAWVGAVKGIFSVDLNEVKAVKPPSAPTGDF